MQETFVKIVQHNFQFLITEFGFMLSKAMESPRGEQWEGNVQYMTNLAFIDLSCTRGELPSLGIGRTKDKGSHLLSIRVIHEYMNLSMEEKRAVLSASEGRQADIILGRKQLLGPTLRSDSMEERNKLQLDAYTKCLYEEALPFLKGDFSQWLAIWEYHVEKLIVENTRAGQPEFVPVVRTDDSGQRRVIGKQPLFKKSLDYIKELQDEQNKPS
jgi:hypothetical protein